MQSLDSSYFDTLNRPGSAVAVRDVENPTIITSVAEYIIDRYTSGRFTLDTIELMLMDINPRVMVKVLSSIVGLCGDKSELTRIVDKFQRKRIINSNLLAKELMSNYSHDLMEVCVGTDTEMLEFDSSWMLNTAFEHDKVREVVECLANHGASIRYLITRICGATHCGPVNWSLVKQLIDLCDDREELEDVYTRCITHLTHSRRL